MNSQIGTIGVVGLGVMGREMARHLRADSCAVLGLDVDPGVWAGNDLGGIERAESLAELAARAQLLVLSLPGPAQVERVLDDIGKIGVSDLIIADTSTVDPHSAERFTRTAAASGLIYAQCPVIGGQTGARQGTLTVIAGVTDSGRSALAEVLPRIGREIHWVDSPAQAATLKLLNNLVSLGNTLVFAEAFALGAKAGISAARVYEVLRTGSAQSTAMDRRWGVNIGPGNYHPGFTIDLALKDLRLAGRYAQEVGVPLLHGSLTAQVYQLLAARGWGGRDVAAIVPWWEEIIETRIGGV